MSGSFKTYPKSILSHNDTDFDPNRVDRYGNNFKYLEQHISFKDKVLEEPLESILEIEQINFYTKQEPETSDKDKQDENDQACTDRERCKIKSSKKKKHRRPKNKHCSCLIQ
ncbi:hypothetical protein SteCoe_35249 [Stentor coeruleus]|uniref:Uncharacterized protein n=1 Tax=Stentor coeruleus TaxID=5963 RepID=A0A1R2AST1_9CILI|nr:hypothetical protein SteCoe_35249 [Stentor coeruleus]